MLTNLATSTHRLKSKSFSFTKIEMFDIIDLSNKDIRRNINDNLRKTETAVE